MVEETGLSVVVGRRSVRTRYDVTLRDGRGASKEVDYWLMHGDGEFVPNDEVDELRWLEVRKALGRVSYPRDRDVLSEALEVLET